MGLREMASKVSGILGKPDRVATKPVEEAFRRDIASLEHELDKVELWNLLAIQDKENVFRKIMDDRIESVKERYHSVDPAGLASLQVQHTLLKEMLFSYLNSGRVRDRISEEIKKKRELYDKNHNTESGK